jgi:hypothetical protein
VFSNRTKEKFWFHWEKTKIFHDCMGFTSPTFPTRSVEAALDMALDHELCCLYVFSWFNNSCFYETKYKFIITVFTFMSFDETNIKISSNSGNNGEQIDDFICSTLECEKITIHIVS